MNKPQAAGDSPCQVDLVEGKKYFFCTCGKSEKQPYCDGSHKGTDFAPHMFEADKTGKAWLCMCKRTCKTPYCDGTHNKPEE